MSVTSAIRLRMLRIVTRKVSIAAVMSKSVAVVLVVLKAALRSGRGSVSVVLT